MPNQDAINALRQLQPRQQNGMPYQPATPQNLGGGYGFDNMQPQPYPGYTPNRFWDNPERVTRYLDAAASIPEGMPVPDWLTKAVPVLTEARSYFEKANPGKSWWEWSELSDDDPMKQALRNLAPPPSYAMYDEEQTENWYNIQRMQPGAQPATPAPTQPGGVVPAGYQPAENVTENRIFGYTQEAWEALPKEQQLMIQIMPAVQRGMAAASGVVIGAGVAGPVGAVVGGLGGLGAAYGAEKSPALAKAMSVLDLPREALERTMGVLYQGYAEGINAYKTGGVDASQDAVANVLNNLPAAWKAAHEFYNVALAGSTVDAEGKRVYGGVFGIGDDPGNKRVIYGSEGVQDITEGNTMREMQALREAIASGTVTPEQAYADLEARYGAGGMLREIVSGFALDPLNILPGSIKDVGGGLAGKLGNAPLETALKGNKTLLGGIQEYGTTLRQLPIEEAARFDAVSRWIAGLDEAGQIKDYAKASAEPNKLKAAFNYLTGMTPKARATEVVNNSAEALKLMIGEDDLTDIETYQTAKALTGVSIEGVVDGAETTRLPKYFTSAEAQLLALALRSKDKAVDAIWDRYRMSRPQAQMLQRMAKVMQRSDAELLDTLKAATPEDADLILREFKGALKQLADGGDKDAGVILQGMTQDANMNGAALKKWAEAFKRPDGPAYNKSVLQAQLVTMFEEGVEKWTVDWFGVKPQHWFFRMSDTMKKAQSYLLLGLSPSYFMNNAINNIVTTGWDGLLSFHTAGARNKMLAEFGVTPSRFSAANTAADVADNTGAAGRILREASTQPGNLQAVSDFLDKGRKVQVASRMSQAAERFSGENAMLTAMLQYWGSHWKPGKGFDKLPQGLRNVLDQMQPGLSKKIENAVAGSKNRAAVEKAIFAELGKRRVTDMFTPDDREILAHFPGLLDGIERGLDKATTPEARRMVFQDARTSMEKQIAADVARNVRRLTEETTNRVMTEGVQAVIDMGYQIAEARADMHWQHRSRLDDLWNSVQGKTGYERRMTLENGLRAEDRVWNAYQNVEGARILGMVKGMGADDPQLAVVTRALMDQHDLWASYFSEKSKAVNELYDTKFATDEEASAAWQAFREKYDELYQERLDGEAGAQAVINAVFADAGEKQWPGSRASFEKWTSDIQHQHEQIGEAVRYFRTGKSKAIDPDVKQLVDGIRKGEKPVDQITDPAIRDALWKEFNQYGYNVLVRRQLDAVNGGSARILNEPGNYARAIQEGKAEGQVPNANAQPAAIPVMVTQNMKRQLADLGYSAEDVRLMKPQAAWDIINAQTAKAVDAIIESAPNTDSRQNSWLRKAVDEMGLEERGEVINWLRNRITTDERTGMKNMAAYLEAERKPNAVAVDITGLKTVNDTWGEASGDILIKAYAKLLNDITEDSYRLHGDLFLLQADNPAMAAEMLANVQTAVDNLIIEVTDAEGQTHYLTGFDIHSAIGTDYENASAGLKANKPARTATGEDRRLVNRVHEIEPKGEDRGGVAERTVEPEQVSLSVEKQRSAIRQRVHEYDPGVTADRHIVNIVKKYGGYAIAGIDDVTADMVQNAFARRSIERLAVGQASDIDARIVQARVAAMEENMTRLELSAPKELTREAWSRDLYDMMPEQADGVIAVTDAIADHWAQENGKTRDDWYNEFLFERGGTEIGGEGLAQFAPAQKAQHPLVLAAKEYFGITNDLREAGYVMPNGELLDLSGKRDTSDYVKVGNRYQVKSGARDYLSRQRSLDHRDVTFISGIEGNATNAMLEYMSKTNSVRIDFNSRSINIIGPLTREQVNILLTFDDPMIEVTDPKTGRSIKSYDLEGASARKIKAALQEASDIAEGKIDPSTLYQGLKGSTRWLKNGKAVIHAFESADVSTIVHEVAHVWMDQLGEGDRGIVSRWLKQQGADIADVKGQEMFARGFERYLADGKAPTPKLAQVFANFKRWMLDIYKAITGSDIDVKLNDEVRAMFDRWMGGEAQQRGFDKAVADTPLAEYLQARTRKKRPDAIKREQDQLRETHRDYVESALKDGHSLRPEVLADYPDLAAKYAPAPEPAAPSMWDRPKKPRQTGMFENGEDTPTTPLFEQAAETTPKQPWQMTWNEYIDEQLQKVGLTDEIVDSSPPYSEERIKAIKIHDEAGDSWRYSVKQAILSGNQKAIEMYPEEYQKFLPIIKERDFVANPWKQKLSDYLAYNGVKRKTQKKNYFGLADDETVTKITEDEKKYTKLHRKIVEQAIREGKPVSAEVLADYPDLAPTTTPGMLFQTTRETTATGADPNTTYDLRYKVVDLNDLVTSHTDTLTENAAFPKELQPRQRDRFAGREQVDRIARELNPDALLTDTHTLDRGAMIVGADNIVESGNGRTIALRRAAQEYPEQFQKYQEALRARLGEYGLSEADLEGIENPVLVRERLTDVDRAKFAAEANQSAAARMSEFEQSLQDAGIVTDRMLAALEVGESQTVEQAIGATSNAEVVRAFVNGLPENERAALMDADGKLSQPGVRRLRDALFAKVYQGEAGQRLLALFSESTDPVIANVKNAMYGALGLTAKAEGLIASGTRDAGLSITGDIGKVVDVYARLKQQGASVADYLKQDSLFENELDPFQMKLLEYLNANGRKTKTLRELMRGYAEAVIDQPDANQGALFEMQAVTKGEILDAVTSKIRPDEETGFAEVEAATRQEEAATVQTGRAGLVDENGTVGEAGEVREPTPAIGAPLGMVDGLHLPPMEEAAIEGYMREIRPLLDRAERAADEPDFDVALPEAAQKEIRRWLGTVYNQMADTKMGMMRYGEARRDFALLNYTRRHGVDNYIGAIMPYQFWYTRSALNWAIRAMTNPAIAANFYRLSRATNGMQEQEGYPTRLRGKMGIKVPFLPDWMGEGVYVDPYKQAFPFAQMLRPWQKREEDMSMLSRKVQSNLDRMIENEEITPEQYEEAISTHNGQVWQRATAEAERDMDSDSLNMGDFMNTIMSYSLPIEVTRRMMKGERDKIGQLPVTRTVQNITAALGVGGSRGVNIEAPFRKMMGMPEIDRFEETGINKLIADMVAEPGSTISPQDALQAMIDREGPVYEEAQRRAGKVDLLKWVGSSLGVDLFPEGEQVQRQLQVEYYNAVEAWKGGDKQAINAFYDKYPEYEARAKAFKDPETQLRTFLISQIWQQYNDMPALQKREATDQLGGLFMDAFVNKETRSYDSISVNQLATWAKAMNGVAPKKAGEVSPYPLKFSSDKDAGAYQDYVDQRAAKWAGIDAVQEQYYALPESERATFERQHPELKRYNEWRTRYLGSHLDVVPYVVGEESELNGYPPDVQKQVYAYRADKQAQYPAIDALQEGYFAIDENDKAGRRAYLKENPQVEEYWDWQQQQASKYPRAAQFIKSDEWVSKALGGYSASGVPQELQGAVDNYYAQKEQAFPGIDATWQEYMALDSGRKRAYWQQHPELQDYLDWQDIQIAATPGIISFVKSDESISRMVLPDAKVKETIARFSSSLSAQMLGAAYTGRRLGSGAKMELRRHYQEQDIQMEFDAWLEALKKGIAP